jgi:hypothetical protein
MACCSTEGELRRPGGSVTCRTGPMSPWLGRLRTWSPRRPGQLSSRLDGFSRWLPRQRNMVTSPGQGLASRARDATRDGLSSRGRAATDTCTPSGPALRALCGVRAQPVGANGLRLQRSCSAGGDLLVDYSGSGAQKQIPRCPSPRRGANARDDGMWGSSGPTLVARQRLVPVGGAFSRGLLESQAKGLVECRRSSAGRRIGRRLRGQTACQGPSITRGRSRLLPA